MSRLELHRLGGCMQPIFRSAEDLEQIWLLDEAHWVATSAPIQGLRCDPVLLDLMDDDDDGRIRPRELKRAVRWLLDRLVGHGGVDAHSDQLDLAALRDDEEGQLLEAAAQRVLTFVDQEGDSQVSLDHVRQVQAEMSKALTAGDGVVAQGAVDDDQVERLLADIAECIGVVHDDEDHVGITEEQLDRFEAATTAWLDWHEHQVSVEGVADSTRAWRALDDIEDKLEEFFALSELASFDPRIVTEQGLGQEELEGRTWASREGAERRLQEAPISRADPMGVLEPDAWINPAWRTRWLAFQRDTLDQMGHEGTVDRADLRRVQALFREYVEWQHSKVGQEVERLGLETLEHWDAHPEIAERLRVLFVAERAVAAELECLGELERLILHQRWMLELVNSFVGFGRFYDPMVRSLIEVGTLIMDGRRFKLCVRIENIDEHRKLARAGLIYLAYVEVLTEPEPIRVAVAVTGRERGRLFVGKRGVFYDTDDHSYEAVVVDLLDNPISVTEALIRPFHKLGEFLAERSEAFTQGRYDALEDTVGSALEEGPPAPEKAGGSARDLFLSGGIALAAVSSAMAYVAETLSKIEVGHMVLSVLVLVALAVVPAALIAGIRIHRRDLSIVLEASGWAINQKLRIPTWAGSVYTQRPPFPDDAELGGKELLRTYRRQVVDPDEASRRGRRLRLLWLLIVILGVVGGVFGLWLVKTEAGAAVLQQFLGRFF